MVIDKKVIQFLVGNVERTHREELGCGDCFDKIHKFAELQLLGKSPEEAMPLVQEHLDNCQECKKEYMSLLEAMNELQVYA